MRKVSGVPQQFVFQIEFGVRCPCVVRLPAANIRVRANEPALLHMINRTIRSARLPGPDRPSPKRRLEILSMLIQCERMEGMLIVEP